MQVSNRLVIGFIIILAISLSSQVGTLGMSPQPNDLTSRKSTAPSLSPQAGLSCFRRKGCNDDQCNSECIAREYPHGGKCRSKVPDVCCCIDD